MENINRSIQCSVDECIHHCVNCDYCSLDKIHVGKHDNSSAEKHCTDCRSFAAKLSY